MFQIFENDSKERIIAAKGAPEAILAVSNLSDQEKEALRKKIQAFGQEGYRILGVAKSAFKGHNFPEKQQDFTFDLKLIGSGSYANVYKYKDTFYNRPFILKRAKKELTDKEVARFKREFDVMNDLSSPYILEVYCYNPDKNEYIMELLKKVFG